MYACMYTCLRTYVCMDELGGYSSSSNNNTYNSYTIYRNKNNIIKSNLYSRLIFKSFKYCKTNFLGYSSY